MKIQRLPEELAAPPATPPAVDPSSSSSGGPQTAATAENYVTGVRLPAPPGSGRRRSLRGATSPPGVKMDVDRPCTMLVCFHDETASTGVEGSGGGGGGSGQAGAQGQSQIDIPEWATQMGLNRTSMHVSGGLGSVFFGVHCDRGRPRFSTAFMGCQRWEGRDRVLIAGRRCCFSRACRGEDLCMSFV